MTRDEYEDDLMDQIDALADDGRPPIDDRFAELDRAMALIAGHHDAISRVSAADPARMFVSATVDGIGFDLGKTFEDPEAVRQLILANQRAGLVAGLLDLAGFAVELLADLGAGELTAERINRIFEAPATPVQAHDPGPDPAAGLLPPPGA